MPWILVGAVVLGVLILSRKGSGSGWSKAHAGIVLSPQAEAFVSALSRRLPFAVTVTSGTRTVESQTTAMLALSDAQLFADYADAFVRDLLDAGRSYDAWLPLVRAAYGDGTLSTSGHLAGNAVDLRTRDLSESQIAQLTAAVRDLGGSPLREYEPPHLHVQIPASASVDFDDDPYAPEVDGVSFDDDDPYGESEQE